MAARVNNECIKGCSDVPSLPTLASGYSGRKYLLEEGLVGAVGACSIGEDWSGFTLWESMDK